MLTKNILILSSSSNHSNFWIFIFQRARCHYITHSHTMSMNSDFITQLIQRISLVCIFFSHFNSQLQSFPFKNNMPLASLSWTMKKNSPRNPRLFEDSCLEQSITPQADSQPERFLLLAPWSAAMTKKWNEALSEIKDFKWPSSAVKVLLVPCSFFQASILILESNYHSSIAYLQPFCTFVNTKTSCSQ